MWLFRWKCFAQHWNVVIEIAKPHQTKFQRHPMHWNVVTVMLSRSLPFRAWIRSNVRSVNGVKRLFIVVLFLFYFKSEIKIMVNYLEFRMDFFEWLNFCWLLGCFSFWRKQNDLPDEWDKISSKCPQIWVYTYKLAAWELSSCSWILICLIVMLIFAITRFIHLIGWFHLFSK